MQQHFERGQQQHKGRGAGLLAKRVDLRRELGRQADGFSRPPMGFHGGAGFVYGQLEDGQLPSQLGLPIIELNVCKVYRRSTTPAATGRSRRIGWAGSGSVWLLVAAKGVVEGCQLIQHNAR